MESLNSQIKKVVMDAAEKACKDKLAKLIEESIVTSLMPYILERLSDDNPKHGVVIEQLCGYSEDWFEQACSSKPAPKKTQVAKEKVVKEKEKKPVEEIPFNDIDNPIKVNLETLSVAQLKAMCKEKTLAHSGTKSMLIDRLKKDLNLDAVDHTETEKPKKRMTKSKATVATVPKVVEKIEREEIVRTRDEYGNIYNPDTGFVFNDDDEVIGKLVKGLVVPLDRPDYETCKEKSLLYTVPYDMEEDDY